MKKINKFTALNNIKLTVAIIIVLTVILAVVSPTTLIALAKLVIVIGEVLFLICYYIALALIFIAPYAPYIVAVVGIIILIRVIRSWMLLIGHKVNFKLKK